MLTGQSDHHERGLCDLCGHDRRRRTHLLSTGHIHCCDQCAARTGLVCHRCGRELSAADRAAARRHPLGSLCGPCLAHRLTGHPSPDGGDADAPTDRHTAEKGGDA